MICVVAVPTANRLCPSQLSGNTWNQRVAKRKRSAELASRPIRDAGSVVGSAAVPRRAAPIPQLAISDATRTRRSYEERAR